LKKFSGIIYIHLNKRRINIFSILFANSPKREDATNDQHSILLGNLKLCIFDTSVSSIVVGNKENAVTKLKDVALLIYLFDATQQNLEIELKWYTEFVKIMQQMSPTFETFVLIHKMDQITERERTQVFENRKKQIEDVTKNKISQFYATSIWDETFFQTWCHILGKLILNPETLITRLQSICSVCECQEIVIFEKSTFGIIVEYNAEKQKTDDLIKYERLSVLLKQTKWNYSKLGIAFGSVVIKNPKFTIFLQEFTPCTYIMMAYKAQNIDPSLIEMNVDYTRKFFQKNPIKVFDWNL